MNGGLFEPNTEALFERGLFFLKEQEFKAASLYFNQILDIDPKNARAFWGLLLADRQCTETSELYMRLSVPINGDRYFKAACEYAAPKQKEEWLEVADLVMLSCHKKVLENVMGNDSFLARKWESHYSSCPSDKKIFEEENKLLLGEINKETLSPKLSLRLYDKYCSYVSHIENELIESLKHLAAEQYCKYMKELFDEITSSPFDYPNDRIVCWADPVPGEFRQYIGLDGRAPSVPDRYIFLAEQILASGVNSVDKYKRVEFCYHTAIALEARDEYVSKRNAFYKNAVMNENAAKEEIAYIVTVSPKTAKYYWQYVLKATNSFSSGLKECIDDSKYRSFMSKTKEDYNSGDAETVIDTQKSQLAASDALYDTILADITTYAEKAIEYASSDEAVAFKESFEKYKSMLLEQKNNNTDTINDRLTRINEKVNGDDAAGKKQSHKKGLIALAFAIAALLSNIFIYKLLEYTIVPTTDILAHPVSRTYLIIMGIISVVLILQAVITRITAKSVSVKAKYSVPVGYRIFVKFSRIVSIMVIPAAVVAFIYSYMSFPKKMGTVTISDISEFEFISNAPACTFSLEADLDLENSEFKGIGKFKGELIGNGHVIRSVVLPKDGFIKNNKGTVSDLCFVSPSSAEGLFIVKENNGIIKNVTVSNVLLGSPEVSFSGISETNNKTVSQCSVTNIGGECNVFNGMFVINKGDITGCTVSNADIKAKYGNGFGSTNNGGKIEGCSFTGSLNCDGDASGFIGTVKSNDSFWNSSSSSIKRCYSSGNLKGGQRLSGFISACEGGEIFFCYSDMNIVQQCTENTDFVGGLVCEVRSDSDPIKIAYCYFGGSITMLPGEACDYVGGLIGYFTYNKKSYSRINLNGLFSVGLLDTSAARNEQFTAKLFDDRYSNNITFGEIYFTEKADAEFFYEGQSIHHLKDRNEILSRSFITEKLKWSDEIWNIEDGSLPTLKPYTPQ